MMQIWPALCVIVNFGIAEKGPFKIIEVDSVMFIRNVWHYGQQRRFII